jgi:uncharacterized protein
LTHRQVTEIVWAHGHPNIQAVHPTTLMFTKERHLSKNGDCIVVITADKSVADLTPKFKAVLQQPNAKLIITIQADDLSEKITATGSPKLILTHPTDMVIRKSDYTCSRTLAICADKSSNDLSRELIKKLNDPKTEAKIELTVTVDN